jgi:hypothetical protein
MNPHETARALAEFFKWAMETGAWGGYDLDGCDIQDKAEALGLLDKEPYDPEVHGETEFEVEPGEDMFTVSNAVKELLK